MYEYIKGTIKYVNSSYIVIENQGIGYIIYVANPYSYEENKDYTIYTYQYIREEENTLYGFKTLEERSLFLKLINVKGLGPKTAIPMLATSSVSGIIDAIDRENILYLKKFPKVGEKLARQIILDLKGKLTSNKNEPEPSEELLLVLENLGYKQIDIKKIIPKVDKTQKLEDQIKEALKLMLR